MHDSFVMVPLGIFRILILISYPRLLILSHYYYYIQICSTETWSERDQSLLYPSERGNCISWSELPVLRILAHVIRHNRNHERPQSQRTERHIRHDGCESVRIHCTLPTGRSAVQLECSKFIHVQTFRQVAGESRGAPAAFQLLPVHGNAVRRKRDVYTERRKDQHHGSQHGVQMKKNPIQTAPWRRGSKIDSVFKELIIRFS